MGGFRTTSARQIRATLSLESPVPEICQTPSGDISVFPGFLDLPDTVWEIVTNASIDGVEHLRDSVPSVPLPHPVASSPVEKAFTGGLA